jgi:small subunit ribosomal protein S16
MVRIRLRRMGAKKQPSYRVVVADSRAPRDGRFIEVIGFYNPRTEPETIQIDEARALHWLGVGAMPSEAVQRLLKHQGTMTRFERLQQGESVEALLAEAEAAQGAAPETGLKTRPVQAQAQPAQPLEESGVDIDADTDELGDEEAE